LKTELKIKAQYKFAGELTSNDKEYDKIFIDIHIWILTLHH